MGNCSGKDTEAHAPLSLNREEVAKHSTPEDCWIIIDNGVYNVSDYWKIHPGGGAGMLQWAGKDATFAFREFNHSNIANQQLKSLGLLVGYLQTEKGEDEALQYRPHKKPDVKKVSDLEDLSYEDGENMFCYQCSATAGNSGCTVTGVCGKTASDSALQDLIVEYCKELSVYALQKECEEYWNEDLYVAYLEATFSTLTNVNYDKSRHVEFCEVVAKQRDFLRQKFLEKNKDKANQGNPLGFTDFVFKKDEKYLVAEGRKCGVLERKKQMNNDDLFGLLELCMYGIKGGVAYFYHAEHLRKEKPNTYDEATRKRIFKELFAVNAGLIDKTKYTMEGLLGLNMDCGKTNLEIMQLLDKGHNLLLGKPTPTEVRCTPVPGKCILVSGHDLNVLLKLLEQTEGKNINIYTHGEMMPAFGYPELRKFKHLIGNFGSAWYDQNNDFAAFPGSIILNSNCLQQPRPSYKHRLFTSQAVGWSDIPHIKGTDYSQLIECALKCPGFKENTYAFKKYSQPSEMTGFGHESLAELLVPPIMAGKVKNIILSGGCDNSDPERDFYRQQMLALPKDTVVLTLGCGKFRLKGCKDQMGNIEGTQVPRLLDVGQCNDSYSAVKTAIALAEILKIGVNDLPLRLVLSWLEQKSVVILLTLLHLGIKNMVMGPVLPAFLTPNLVQFLVKNFGISTIEKNDLYHSHNPNAIVPYLSNEFEPKDVIKEFATVTRYQKYKLIKSEQVAKSTIKMEFAFRNSNSVFSLPVGKHVMLRLKNQEGNFISRVYTPINKIGDKGFFTIIVKVYENGLVSSYLNKLAVGSFVEFQGGHGSNLYENGVLHVEEKVYKAKKFNFFAGGSALVQFFHIMQAICEQKEQRTPVSLIASFLEKDMIILAKEFDEMMLTHKDHFKMKTICADTDGYVNKALFEKNLHLPEGQNVINIICGPKKFVHACVDILKEMHFEDSTICKFF